jgi:hypothetical protein
MNKLLTIGMSTYDDFDGVYFSIQALRMYHPILKDIDYELLVIDNNPDSTHGESVRSLIQGWTSGKGNYIPFRNRVSTAVRNEIFTNASGKYTISIDCHVFIENGGLEKLLEYYANNQDCKDIVQGPLIYDDLLNYSTEFTPEWRGDMYGIWNMNKEAYDTGIPFEIPMMGLGLFSCETKNWQGFNPHFKGFGGEEGYIHEKFRINGGKAICIPQLKWLHRFNRPNGVKYPLILEDRIWNYFIGWLEITKDPNHYMIIDIYNNFKTRIPQESLDNILEKAKNQTFNLG